MELSERIENLGGGSSAYAGYGGIGLFLMAIFLIILFAAFRQHHNNGDMASVANVLGEFHPRENCADKLTWSRYANYMDPEVARNHTETAPAGRRVQPSAGCGYRRNQKRRTAADHAAHARPGAQYMGHPQQPERYRPQSGTHVLPGARSRRDPP